MSPPAIVIRIELERGWPRVVVDALNDGEYLRLEDWLRSRPRLAEMVRLAVELELEERVA